MPRAEAAPPFEIAPRTHAISALVELGADVSWVAPSARGFEPSNCYLLLGGDEALLVDTGLRAHGPTILDQVRSMLSPDTRLRLTMTRVEPDCLGNIDRLAEEVGLAEISSQTNVIPLDYIGPLSTRYPDTSITNGLLPGDSVRAGDRELVVVEPAVRTLPTLWYYDGATRTLFTSDFFGGAFVEGTDWSPLDPPDAAATRAHLLAKFDWLAIADTSAAISRLNKLWQRFDIEAIAPGHGLWAVGREAVERRFETTLTALESLGTRGEVANAAG